MTPDYRYLRALSPRGASRVAAGNLSARRGSLQGVIEAVLYVALAFAIGMAALR